MTQQISGVHSITGAGDAGNLTVDVQPGVEANVDLGGGAGSDDLTYAGTGNAQLTAGALASTLIGGYGENTLTGGPGDDHFVGGQGSNLMIASLTSNGQGKKSYVIPLPNRGTIILGGNAQYNSVELLGLLNDQDIAVTPSIPGAFNVDVTDYSNITTHAFTYTGGSINSLVLSGQGAETF